MVSPGRKERFRNGTLNYFSRLWGIEAVLSCLVPGCGVIKAERERVSWSVRG